MLEEDGPVHFASVFDDTNMHWQPEPVHNRIFLQSVQNHMNDVLNIRGHVFVNDIWDSIRMPRTRFGQIYGWLKDAEPSYIDLQLTEKEGAFLIEPNVQGLIWDKI